MNSLPPCVARLLWDIDPQEANLERDRWLIIERVMSRGTWDAMVWLREQFPRDVLGDFVRRKGSRCLSPRDLAYWALICDVDLPAEPGGGRPRWAGP